MTSIIDQIVDYLTEVDVLGDWTCFKSYMPDAPDRAMAIVEFSGESPETTMAVDYPAFQVRVRGSMADYSATRDHAEIVYRALHARELYAGTAEPLVYVIARQQPFPVERDGRERITFAFNCRSMRRLDVS